MFKNIRYRYKCLKVFFGFAKRKKFFLILMFSSALAFLFINLLYPQIYEVFIDKVIVASEINQLTFVLVAYISLYFLESILNYIKFWSTYKITNYTLLNVRERILSNFLVIPFQEYQEIDLGEMKVCLEDDTNTIKDFYYSHIVDYVISFLSALISLILLFSIEWRLSIFSILAIPLTFFIDSLISKKEKRINEEKRDNRQQVSSWLHTVIHGWRELRAMNLERIEKRKFIRLYHTNMICNAKWINYRTARIFVIPKIKNKLFMQCGLYFFGGFLMINGDLQIGELLVFVMYYNILSNSINTISSSNAELKANRPHTDRLIVNLQADKPTYAVLKPDDTNIIKFKSVSFKYPNRSEYVLKDFNVEIHRGERIAIVGKSGAGKTTVLKLITKMLSPTSGQVLFGNINLEEIDVEALHSKIGFIMQESFFFNTTIKNNLLYAKSDATDEEIYNSCKKACILDFVKSLPNGFETIIGENGVKLSGGQRQRLALARLFLREVEVFIFDEATSAVDQHTETLIHDTIKNIDTDKTIIIVSHREASVDMCDRIVEIK